MATAEAQRELPDPGDIATFERCRLDAEERRNNVQALALHADLIALRQGDAVFSTQRAGALDGAVLSNEAFVLRFFGDAGDDRLVLVNLGRDLELRHAPEPLLAPPEGRAWQLVWSSEDAKYGGEGTPPLEREGHWHFPGECAVVFTAGKEKE